MCPPSAHNSISIPSGPVPLVYLLSPCPRVDCAASTESGAGLPLPELSHSRKQPLPGRLRMLASRPRPPRCKEAQAPRRNQGAVTRPTGRQSPAPTTNTRASDHAGAQPSNGAEPSGGRRAPTMVTMEENASSQETGDRCTHHRSSEHCEGGGVSSESKSVKSWPGMG